MSLTPPLILFCLGKDTRNIGAYTGRGSFAVNILSDEQLGISEIFASKAINKFRDIDFQQGENGCPIIPGCVAILECNLINAHDGGDHVILVGEVSRIRTTDRGTPLLRYRGRYATIGEEQ